MDPDEALGGVVCPVCGYDDDIQVTADTGVELTVTCLGGGSGHPQSWTQRRAHAPLQPTRDGLGAELGIYEDLHQVLDPGDPYVEYGVVEHRYASLNRAAYDFLVARYSHTAYGPTRYSASVFIGSALWTLQRGGFLERVDCPATGFWRYNHRLSA